MVHWTWLIVVWVGSVIGTAFVVSLCIVSSGADAHIDNEHIGDAGQLK